MLVIRNLATWYDRIQALKGVTVHISRGEVVCLIGANGSGKTTLLHAVSGLLKHIEGEILLEGKSIAGLPAERIVRQGIGHAPEGRRLFAPLNVTDNLRLGAYTRSDRDEIKRDMDWVYTLFPRLAERRRQAAGTLSGGEQQMLSFGRALMCRPRLLLLDEPSTGLAPLIIEEIFAVIEQLRREGKTILLVEQNARLALKTADRGYVMETGRIVLTGTSEELTRSPDVQRAYLGSSVDGFLGGR